VDLDFSDDWPRYSIVELIQRWSSLDLNAVRDPEALRAWIKNPPRITIDGELLPIHELNTEDVDKMGYASLVDHVYKKCVRRHLINPCFVTGHPIELSPLARRSDANPSITDRFQLVVNGWEVVNAYSELVDPDDQRGRFEEQAKAKQGGDEEAMESEEDYLVCMEHGMPPTSGWGMGIDRLVTLLSGQENLRDSVLFPLMRPE
jgi:lysyl-tRNA synthetase class 2